VIQSQRPSLDQLYAARARSATPPLYPSPSYDPDTVSLTYGFADPLLFPYADLAAANEAVLREEGPTALNYFGASDELVEQIVARLRAEGVEAEHEQIALGYGSTQMLGLLPRVFVDPGDTVIVEGPTFLGAVRQFARDGARLLSVPVDADGMDVDALEVLLRDQVARGVRPKFIYTIPTFHNPSGATLSLARRHKLVALAAEYGVLVVEDDAYGELRFEGTPLPHLAALDAAGWVLRVSTFSKTLAPGVRVGWAYGNPDIVQRFAMLRSEGESGPLITRLVAHYCRNGRLEAHIAELVQAYRHKRNVMLDAIKRELPTEVRYIHPEGGFFVWCRLPDGMRASALLPVAVQHGVEFLPGTACFADGSGDEYIRLAFSYQPADRIALGIARLGAVMRAL
jgi:2-aminoadipate transaminase